MLFYEWVGHKNKQFEKLDFNLINNADIEEKVTVIIPARNEERTIQKVIRLVQKNTIVNQIIVVDNNSIDNTAKLAKNVGAEVIFCKEQGKGFRRYPFLLGEWNCNKLSN